MQKFSLLFLALTALPLGAAAQSDRDSLRVVDLDEVVVISSPKENTKLRQTPSAVTMISGQEMQNHQVLSLKGASTLSPNFFMPDYGSHLTSAVYIRGVGSRINTPAVGMYVDNIPYIDKSAFDFNFFDIERMEILRGPQGTLYGRNTMAGLVKIHTRNPFNYQGTDVKLGYATRDNHRSASITHYQRISDKFAFSGGGYYEGSDGFFKNSVTGKNNDYMESAGAKLRAIWKPSEAWTIDMNAGYDYSDEGGYPYYYTGSLTGTEQYSSLIGTISNNQESNYRREMVNAGINVEYQSDAIQLNAVTGYQHLDDRMFLDQDFLSADIYTLEQKQQLNTLTEEITLRSKGRHTWDWLVGASGFVQGLRTTGPVTFHSDGISWMQNLMNGYMPDLSAMGMSMGVTLKDDELLMDGTFKTPVLNGALFHQSTFHLGDHLTATLGLRLDYEHTKLHYDSNGTINYDFAMTSARMPINLKDLQANAAFLGDLQRDYTQLLPKFALQYDFDSRNNIYATVSKGYRSGGYNVQMFSDLLQGDLRTSMMSGIKTGTSNYLDQLAKRGMPQSVIDMIKGYLDLMPEGTTTDVKSAVIYKPEYTWNYELGTHLGTADQRLQLDMSAFLMDTRNQQIARFTDYGLGRMMVNAGHSQSYGVELSARAIANRHLDFNLNYGYTHATFKDYDDGSDTNYTGNYVPFVPMHTLNIGANYKVYFNRSMFHTMTIGAQYTGAGRIYWTEANNVSQAYYQTLSANITLASKWLQINLWGRNLGNAHYNTFYFESMSRGFEQHCKPFQLGIDLTFHI